MCLCCWRWTAGGEDETASLITTPHTCEGTPVGETGPDTCQVLVPSAGPVWGSRLHDVSCFTLSSSSLLLLLLQVFSQHRSVESTTSASQPTVPPTSPWAPFSTKTMQRSSWSPTSSRPGRAATRRPTAPPCCWRQATSWRWCCGTTRRSGTTATTTAPSAASCCSPCEDQHVDRLWYSPPRYCWIKLIKLHSSSYWADRPVGPLSGGKVLQ